MAFRKWLRGHHATAKELWVGFYKKDSGKPGITWPESVDEALCLGWIDGVRKRIDEESYVIRFTSRRRESIWSAINIRRVVDLTNEKRMQPAGLAAFAARVENKSGIFEDLGFIAQIRERLTKTPTDSSGSIFPKDKACASHPKRMRSNRCTPQQPTQEKTWLQNTQSMLPY